MVSFAPKFSQINWGDIVRRNLMIVTLRVYRVNVYIYS